VIRRRELIADLVLVIKFRAADDGNVVETGDHCVHTPHVLRCGCKAQGGFLHESLKSV